MEVKTVVIVNDFNYLQGGASKVAIDTARLLKESNMNVIFFSAVSREDEKIQGVKYITTNQNEALKEKNKLKGIINGIYNFKAKKELKKLLKTLDKNSTIIHVHGWTKALSSSVFDIAFKMKFKVVLTLHEYFSICPNGALFDYKKECICTKEGLSIECVTCNCDSRNYLFKLYRVFRFFVQNKIVKLNEKLRYAIGISDMSIELIKPYFDTNIIIEKIYNPVEIKKISNNNISQRNKKYYLYVGRVDKEKGTSFFCEIMSELGLKAIVIGNGKEMKMLEKKYKNIEFKGWKPTYIVYEYMKNAEAVIVPSIWYESAGLTIVESQILNTPCIVSRFCAGKEFVKYGYVYDNKEDLKNCLTKKIYTRNNENIDLGIFSSLKYIENVLRFYNK